MSSPLKLLFKPLIVIIQLSILAFNLNAGDPLWTNPIVHQRADPHIVLHDDEYYFIATVPEYDRIEIRKADQLSELDEATAHVVWRRPESGKMCGHIWAPELHRIDEKWYIYFAAGNRKDGWEIRMFVLENCSSDPTKGEWEVKGQIDTGWDSFSLDATVFSLHHKNYLIWAQNQEDIPGNTNLYIAELLTPWSIKGKPVLITKPELEWEKIGFLVNEGPYVLHRNGKLFLTYSASATDHNYCVGLLTADENANVLRPESWHKSSEPIFVSNEANSIFGPGHNSFTTSKDGKRDILIYHARSYKEIEGDPLSNPDRHTRAQFIDWDNEGTLVLGNPASDGPYYGTSK